MQRILVLDRGRIVEEGDHTTLLANRGIYHRLASAYEGGEA
jgi:ABC-type multidrug transport system fused ATPase/permease subunit